jgi:hypothetical protein
VELLAQQSAAKKWAGWNKRFYTSWGMFFGFIGLLYTGHIMLCAFVMLIQITMFKEIVSLGSSFSKEGQLPGFRHLYWYDQQTNTHAQLLTLHHHPRARFFLYMHIGSILSRPFTLATGALRKSTLATRSRTTC